MKEKLKHASWLKPKPPQEPTAHAKECLKRIRAMIGVDVPQNEKETSREPGQDDEELAA